MAYNSTYFGRLMANKSRYIKSGYTYNGSATGADEALATIVASGYFNDLIENDKSVILQVNDLIFVEGNDAVGLYTVSSVTTNVTLASLASAVAGGSIVLAMLDAGITPSHITKFAGIASDGGGSATVALTVAGVAATDVVFAQVSASTNAVSVQKVTASTDTITILLSGDPGASTKISYQVQNAAA